MTLGATRLAGLLWLCALTRALLPAGPPRRGAQPPPHLPVSLDAEPGQSLPLVAAERLLLSSPGVSLERRRYGSSEVALVSSLGLRELHPPGVCLSASGLQIVERGEEPSPAGCLGWLRLRSGPRELHFRYVFFGERTVTCKFWRRGALGLGDQLIGRSARWSTLQVMDADAGRARRRLLALLDATKLESHRSGGTP